MKLPTLGLHLIGISLLLSGCASSSVSSAPIDPNAGTVAYSSSELAKQPKAVKMIPPVYPIEMKRVGMTGEALIECIITPDGRPTQVRVLSATNPLFAQAGVDAISQWEFEPGMKDGMIVSSRIEFPVHFNLGN